MHDAVPMSTTLLFLGLLVAMVLSLALEEKIHAKKSVITGVFAVIALVLGEAMHLHYAQFTALSVASIILHFAILMRSSTSK